MDVQSAINQRSLTYRCSSDSDLEVITTNCFLRPNANLGLVLKLDDQDVWKSDSPSRLNVVKSIEARDSMLTRFHKLWYQDYLLSLREQCKDLHEVNFHNRINVDDVVLVKNPAKSRPFWLLGRVLELIVGDDKKIRSVKVKRGDGSVQVHSIKLLYPLELSLTHAHHPKIIPDLKGVCDRKIDVAKSKVSNDVPDTKGTSVAIKQRPKRTKNLKGSKNSPNNPYVYY